MDKQLFFQELEGYISKFNKILGRKMNEADTKRLLIDKLLKIMGWDEYEDIKTEVRIPGAETSADYVLEYDNKKYMIIEVKSFDRELGNKEAAQTVQYGVHGNCPWCLLTNGNIFRLYNAFWREEAEGKLVFETSVKEGRKKFNIFAAKMFFLSKDSLINGTLEEISSKIYMSRKIENLFSDPSPEVINLIKKEIGAEISDEQIISYLRSISLPGVFDEAGLKSIDLWTEPKPITPVERKKEEMAPQQPRIVDGIVQVNQDFSKDELEDLLSSMVRAPMGKDAVTLREAMLQNLEKTKNKGLTLKTYQRFSKWCHTGGTYKPAMEIARKISILLFGYVVKRQI